MSEPITDRLLAGASAADAYRTSILFRRVVDTVRASERHGMDGVAALGQILIDLSRARDAETAAAVQRAMRTMAPLVFCAQCAQGLRLGEMKTARKETT